MEIINSMKETLLERRIARLEKLVKESVKGNTIQSTDFDKLESDVKKWFWNTCDEDAYDSVSSWYEHMMAASNHNNNLMVDEVMYYLRDKYDKIFLNKMRDHIKDILAKLAKISLHDYL